jgi:hypothetical protein
MPSVLKGMDNVPRHLPQKKDGSHGKYFLAVVVMVSVLILYLR